MGSPVIFVGPKWRAAWSSSTAYNVNDLVSSSGVVYIAKVGNINLTPASNPTQWDVYSTGGSGTPGPGYLATSSTSLTTAGSGSKTFTTQSALAYSTGCRCRATSAGSGDWMEGIVSSYSGTTLVVAMDTNSGTGTHTDWNLNVAGSVGPSGPALTPAGTWSSATTYGQSSVVTFSGKLYASLSAGNLNNTPAPGGTAFWEDLSSTGLQDPGANGPLKRTALNTTGIADANDLSSGSYAAGTGTNTVTATLSPAIASYATGAVYRFIAQNANTGAVTINFNTLGAKTIKKPQGGVTTDLVAGDIQAGQAVVVVYDGTNMQMVSQLGNAPAASGSTVLFTAGTASSAFIQGLGGSASDATSTTPPTPAPRAGTLRNLRFNAINFSGATITAIARINGVDSALSASATNSATGSDATHTVSVSAGDLIAVHATSTASGGGSIISISMQFD